MLGPLVAREGERVLPIGGPLQRGLLAMLALETGRIVSTDRLIDGLWGEHPPTKPLSSLQVYVHGLRRAFGGPGGGREVLRSQPPGYRLDLDPAGTDLVRFEQAWERARSLAKSGDAVAARDALSFALAQWRGPALEDLRGLPFAQAYVARLDDARLLAVEDLIDLRLACGEHGSAALELESLVIDHPTRERFWAQLMIALYRADRQADALATFARARDRLADELGIDPGEALRALEVSILRHDPELAAPELADAPATAPTGRHDAEVPESTRSDNSASALPRPRAEARVPRPVTRTVGRDDLLTQLRQQLADGGPRLLSLVGPGGTGKTRLAIELAAGAGGFPGGVFFASATDEQGPEEMFGALALAAGGAEPKRAGLEGAVDAVAATLPTGRVLLVLDNLEALAEPGVPVAAILEAIPALTVVTTSRVPLRLSSEYVVIVPPLRVPESRGEIDPQTALDYPAVELFVERARTSGPRFELTEATVGPVVELCRLLDGIPLAVELVAARMRHLAPATAVDRLRRSLDLVSTTALDLPARQRTLAGTIQWSIDYLPGSARSILADLVIFEDGFDLETLEAVSGAQTADVFSPIEHLGVLVDAGLVRLKDTRVELRYQVLSTVRAQLRATGQLPADREETLRVRHLALLTERLQELIPLIDRADGDLVLARFADEQEDILALLDWAIAHGRAEAAAELGVGAADAWLATGWLRRGRDVLARLGSLELPDSVRDRVDVAEARLAYHLGDAGATEGLCRSVLQRPVEPAVEATARCYLGAALVGLGRVADGIAAAEGALALARETGDAGIQAVTLSVLAIGAAMQGDFAAERARYLERLDVVRAQGDRTRIADTLNTLAEIAIDEADLAAARDHVDEALRLAGPHRLLERRDALITAARISAATGELSRLAAELGEALEHATRTEQPLALAQCARTVATVLAGQGRSGDALRLFAHAHALAPPPTGERAPMESDLAGGYAAAVAALSPDTQERVWLHAAAQPAEVAESLRAVLAEFALTPTGSVGDGARVGP